MLLLYLVIVICVYLWGTVYSGVLANYLLTAGLLEDSNRPFVILVIMVVFLTLFAALARLMYRRHKNYFGSTQPDEPGSIAMMLLVMGLLPFTLFLTDSLIGWQLLDPSCSARHAPDYFWLTLDSFAKGVMLDLMESFHMDIYACGPNHRSLLTSTIVFGMRTFITYIVIFGIMKIYLDIRTMERDDRFGAD